MIHWSVYVYIHKYRIHIVALFEKSDFHSMLYSKENQNTV
jgi:hypothetical protein